MTTIAYHKLTLVADRRFVNLIGGVSYREGRKLFISDNGQIAYGVSGRSIELKDRQKIELFLQRLITLTMLDPDIVEHCVPHKDVGVDDITKQFPEFEKEMRVLVMIKTRAYFVLIQDENTNVAEITEFQHALGSGGMYLRGMVRCGIPIEEGIKRIHELDMYTGGTFDIVRAETLSPFIIGE